MPNFDKVISTRGIATVFAPLLLFAAGAVAGCGDDEKPLPPKPATREWDWSSRPIAGPAMAGRISTPVKVGPAPLAYLAEGPGTIRVVDVTSGKELGLAPVTAGVPMSIDETSGVHVGRLELVHGPLPEGHRYAIYLETGAPGMTRSGYLGAPQPARPPAGAPPRPADAAPAPESRP